MKKRLSVLLSIIIVLSICAPITSVMAEEARKQSVLKTGKEIAALCSEYDNYNELDSTDEQTINTRLIVKSDDKIEEYDAIDSVYGFGYAFLQYADDESAEFAKTQYENAGYTATNCAERTAFFKAVSEGVLEFDAICVVGGMNKVLKEYAAPCGVCRQVMMEFCDPDTFQIILATSKDQYEIFTLKELGFGPNNLK